MATHSSILAWRIPGTEELGGLLSVGSHRVGHDWSNLAAAAAILYASRLVFFSIEFGNFSGKMSFKYKSLNLFWDVKYDLYTVCFTSLTFFHMLFIPLSLYTFFWSLFQFITFWFACVSPAFKSIFDFLLLTIVILVVYLYFIFYGFEYLPGVFNLRYYFCAYVKLKVCVWWCQTCFWVICELRVVLIFL